jgi:phosphoribulokinase
MAQGRLAGHRLPHLRAVEGVEGVAPARFGGEPGTFTPWEEFAEGSELLFYEGLHGALVSES